ncbi:MAG: protein translocase subunit SecD [Candidatus Cyclonatronum sp.]|uniref:protein translocase subunit SecD n=1 Tax=Cyclonatronum sp. TaxID=3024185 RepID=UPI0025C4D99F|nr:protein translocase subunit SecD [Cyclonatronum sp.]MCC5933292.1 protein translocase subunit SecD [Balneolales bacterium]MCH8485386.1 protein translocase subunit SecD [Cyclonatronum sp.]
MKQTSSTKILFILGFLVLTGYYLQFSVRHWLEERHINSLSPEEQVEYRFANAERLTNLRTNALSFGLDLQGGMYVTLELATGQLIGELAREQRDDLFDEVLQAATQRSQETNIDIVAEFINEFERRDPGARLSRYFHMNTDELTRASTNDEVRTYLEAQRNRAVDRAVEIIRNRIDRFGVTEPSIVRSGANRVVVELPGVDDDQDRVRNLLRGTARLEFRTMANPNELRSTFERVVQILTETEVIEDEDGESQTITRNPLGNLLLDIGGPDVRFGYATAQDTAAINALLAREAVQRVIPANIQLMWGARSENIGTGTPMLPLLGVRSQVELTGDVITDARPAFDPTTNAPEVSMSMNREGARTWSMITAANIGRPVAIILDGMVYSYPTVRTQIADGRSSISGLGGLAEAEDLVNILLSGALPAPLEIIEERTVGATLGEASIRAGFNSALFGLMLVAIFMIMYYRTAGGIANIALILNIVFILGILSAFQATLTLPGIAGIVLTIGMAVDANVLIFDRIREEQRAGKSLIASIESGYANAMSAILDANITTFLTAVILFSFGMGPIKGFAVTLMAGIVASLFSAIVITRVVVDWLARGKGNAMSFG